MEVCKALYISEELKEKKHVILKKIKKKKALLNTYVIVLTPDNRNQLEIFNLALNVQKSFSMEEVLIVGIANGFYQVLEMMKEITQEVYEATGDGDLRSFIIAREKELKESEV